MIKASATFLWDWMKERWTSIKYILANLNGMLYINQYQCFQFFIWFFALRASINTVQFWLCFGPSLPLQFIRLNDKRAKWREKNNSKLLIDKVAASSNFFFVKYFIYTEKKISSNEQPSFASFCRERMLIDLSWRAITIFGITINIFGTFVYLSTLYKN